MADRYWVGNGGDWTDTAHWAASSNGAGGETVPTENDDVYIDYYSFNKSYTSPNRLTIQAGCKCKNINFSPRNLRSIECASGQLLDVYGTAYFSSNSSVGNLSLNFCGTTGEQTLGCAAGASYRKFYKIKITYAGATFYSNTSLYAGRLEINSDYATFGVSTTSISTTITAIGITMAVFGTFIIESGASCDFTGSTILLTSSFYSTVTGSIDAENVVFNNIEALGNAIIKGNNTWNDIKAIAGRTLQFESGTIQIINSLSANGTKGNLVYLRSSILGQTYTLQSPNAIEVERYDIRDSTAVGNFIANSSYDNGGNTGWEINSPGSVVTYKGQDFDERYFTSGAIQTQAAPAGDSLAFDTMHLQVWHDGYNPPLGYNFYTADDEMFLTDTSEEYLHLDIIQNFVPGDPMLYYYDDILINKFYVQEIRQVGKQLFDVYAVSAIGLLSNSMHYGGIYTGTDIEDILAELLDGITYEVDPLVATIKVYGWLPYATKRDNLQQLTLAHSISLKLKTDGTLLVSTHRAEPTGTLGNNRTSLMGSVEKINPVTAVQVSEHAFDEIATTISLCNDSFLTERLIIFPEPCHDLVITNGTIVSSSANHAIVQGSGTVTLTGQTYAHTLKRVTAGTVTGDSSDNILFVDNATLVTSLNSSKVVAKLFNAFSADEIVKTDILFGDERTGDTVNIVDPYSALVELAFARKMDITFGGFLKSQAEFVKGFTPAGAITGYQNRVLITEDGNWAVPAGVNEVRAVLVGGGTGGSGGATGETGENGRRFPSSAHGYSLSEVRNGTGGAGGLFGAGGAGGLVLDTGAMAVTPAQNLAIAIGAGGAGGATGTAGSDGGNTTLDALSSATGERLDRGYTDILSSNVYGIPGFVGRSGKDGRGDTNYMESIRAYYDGYTTGDEYCRLHGLHGNHDSDAVYESGVWKTIYAIGGSGGGAAWATSLDDGWEATCGLDGYASKLGSTSAVGGNGGAGRIPQVGLNATVYGSGGHGGNGGGGGGGGGACINGIGGASHETFGAGGAGGTGSAGGNGKAGCVILYY